jgi:hypothetical protein
VCGDHLHQASERRDPEQILANLAGVGVGELAHEERPFGRLADTLELPARPRDARRASKTKAPATALSTAIILSRPSATAKPISIEALGASKDLDGCLVEPPEGERRRSLDGTEWPPA